VVDTFIKSYFLTLSNDLFAEFLDQFGVIAIDSSTGCFIGVNGLLAEQSVQIEI